MLDKSLNFFVCGLASLVLLAVSLAVLLAVSLAVLLAVSLAVLLAILLLICFRKDPRGKSELSEQNNTSSKNKETSHH